MHAGVNVNPNVRRNTMSEGALYVAQIEVGDQWVDAIDPSTPNGLAQYPTMEAVVVAPREPSFTYRVVRRRAGAADEVMT